ncbi:Uncharacterised protein [Salmonella enterica subsp. enterica]|nr:Uncharacterised protein [Salmonella enterica subsp. enterica]
MVFFAFRHHGNDQRRAKRRITRFFDRFLIASGSDSASFKHGAEAVAPPLLQSQKNATAVEIYDREHAFRPQNVL